MYSTRRRSARLGKTCVERKSRLHIYETMPLVQDSFVAPKGPKLRIHHHLKEQKKDP